MGLFFLPLNMTYWRGKKKISEEDWQERLNDNTKFAQEVYQSAEEKSKLFSKNIRYLLKRSGLSQVDLEKRLSEQGLSWKPVRIRVLEDYHGRYPALIEMCFISKFFGLSDPSIMIMRDIEAHDRFTSD
jgi:hypothetical protein